LRLPGSPPKVLGLPHDERKTSGASGGELSCVRRVPPKSADVFSRSANLAFQAVLVICVFSVRAAYCRRHQSALAAWGTLGCRVGLISLFASKIAGRGGQVLSFEPSPDILALLRRNTESENIKVLPYGIGNADTIKSFAARGTSSAASCVEDVTAINRRFHPDQPVE
jgi:hypothetical protein